LNEKSIASNDVRAQIVLNADAWFKSPSLNILLDHPLEIEEYAGPADKEHVFNDWGRAPTSILKNGKLLPVIQQDSRIFSGCRNLRFENNHFPDQVIVWSGAGEVFVEVISGLPVITVRTPKIGEVVFDKYPHVTLTLDENGYLAGKPNRTQWGAYSPYNLNLKYRNTERYQTLTPIQLIGEGRFKGSFNYKWMMYSIPKSSIYPNQLIDSLIRKFAPLGGLNSLSGLPIILKHLYQNLRTLHHGVKGQFGPSVHRQLSLGNWIIIKSGDLWLTGLLDWETAVELDFIPIGLRDNLVTDNDELMELNLQLMGLSAPQKLIVVDLMSPLEAVFDQIFASVKSHECHVSNKDFIDHYLEELVYIIAGYCRCPELLMNRKAVKQVLLARSPQLKDIIEQHSQSLTVTPHYFSQNFLPQIKRLLIEDNYAETLRRESA